MTIHCANLAQPPGQVSMVTVFHSYLSSTDIAVMPHRKGVRKLLVVNKS